MIAIGSSLMVLIVSALLYYGVMNIRLVISPSGITYYSLGYQVRTSWDNIAGLGEAWTGRAWLKGLVLRQPAVEVDWWLRPGLKVFGPVVALRSGHPLSTRIIEPYSKIIPLGLFARDWPRSALGAAIRHYAPQAFAETPQ